MLTNWLDPSVIDETDSTTANPDLDMFNAEHGPPYEASFVTAIARRSGTATTASPNGRGPSSTRLQGLGMYDRLFNVNRAWADLRFADLTIDPSDREVGCYVGDPKWANYSPFGLGTTNTLRTWLSMWSLSASQCKGSAHLQRITVPSLVIQSTADRGVFPSDARLIHGDLAATDKQLEFLPGEHYFEDGGRDLVTDLIAAWVGMRQP